QVSSIVDAVPPDQAAKLAVIDQIRAQIDKAGGELDDLRPPDGLRAVTAADLPAELRSQLTERDGHVGRIIAVRPGATFDELDGRDLIAFSTAVRHVHGKIAGGALLFADVLLQIQKDGPVVTAIAAFGLVVMVGLVVGRTRRAVAVLAATASGT